MYFQFVQLVANAVVLVLFGECIGVLNQARKRAISVHGWLRRDDLQPEKSNRLRLGHAHTESMQWECENVYSITCAFTVKKYPKKNNKGRSGGKAKPMSI